MKISLSGLRAIALVLTISYAILAFFGNAPLVLLAGIPATGAMGAIVVLEYNATKIIPIFSSLIFVMLLIGVSLWSLALIAGGQS